MPKYIKKCYNCKEIFSQEVDPKNFTVKGLCDKCDKELKSKVRVIDVNCFSMSGDYVCPYYGKFDDDESKKHCHKCWHPFD